MPQPTVDRAHLDVPLTQLSLAYMQDESMFIARRVFPMVNVRKKTDKYWTYPKSQWFKDDYELRGDAQESVGSGWELSDDSYSCDVYALHKDIGEQTDENADEIIEVEETTAEWLGQQALIHLERKWNNLYFKTGVWGTDVNVTAKWDAAATNVITQVRTGILKIMRDTGKVPNKFVLGVEAWNALKENANIVNRIQHTSRESVTTQMVAELFRLHDNMRPWKSSCRWLRTLRQKSASRLTRSSSSAASTRCFCT